MKPMTITVPAREEWALVLRLAVSGVSAVMDVPLDVMEDLCTAVEESADLLLHQPYAAQALSLSCEDRPDGLQVVLSAQERTPRQEDQAVDADIARMILKTLVREVTLDRDEGGVRSVCLALPAKD